MIVDTNVIIDVLNGNSNAYEFIYSQLQDDLYLSVVSISEVYSGIKDYREEELFKDLLTLFNLVQVNKEIAVYAGQLRREYRKSHGIEIPDALIAATANHLEVPVATLDKKHFSVLAQNLIVPY